MLQIRISAPPGLTPLLLRSQDPLFDLTDDEVEHQADVLRMRVSHILRSGGHEGVLDADPRCRAVGTQGGQPAVGDDAARVEELDELDVLDERDAGGGSAVIERDLGDVVVAVDPRERVRDHLDLGARRVTDVALELVAQDVGVSGQDDGDELTDGPGGGLNGHVTLLSVRRSCLFG